MENIAKCVARIGVLGLGRCGGRIAAAFATRGYPAAAMSGSPGEVHGLDRLGSARFEIGTNGEGWAGTAGRVAFWLHSAELVLAVGGLGGNTGGRLAELVAALAAAGLPSVAIGVLPSRHDSHHARARALAAVNELCDAPFESLVLVDNQKLFGQFATDCMGSLLPSCNAAIADAFASGHTLGEQSSLVPIRSFDHATYVRILRAGGVALFGSRELEGKLDHESLLQAFVDVVQNNRVTAGEHELDDMVALGSVLVASERHLEATAAGVLDTYFDEVQLLTSGATHALGIYQGDVDRPTLHVIAAGLALPSVVPDLLAQLAEEAERVSAKRAAVRGKLVKLDLSGLASLAGSSTPAPPGARASAPGAPRSRDRQVAELDPDDVTEMPAPDVPAPPGSQPFAFDTPLSDGGPRRRRADDSEPPLPPAES